MPGVTVDRQCGSSQQAVHFAAQAVLSGTADLVVAGGVQNMSMVPIAAAMALGDPFSGSVGWRARYGAEKISQFRAALAPLRGWPDHRGAVQIADGAAALLIASDYAVGEHGLRPRARIAHLSARGDDPVPMLTAPIAATAHALRRAGMSLDEIDLVEINEAFASVVLAWQRETGADLARVNACGGADRARPPARRHRRPAADHPGSRP